MAGAELARGDFLRACLEAGGTTRLRLETNDAQRGGADPDLVRGMRRKIGLDLQHPALATERRAPAPPASFRSTPPAASGRIVP